MLVSGALVLTGYDKSVTPVEELEVGQLVFSPITEQFLEILDIRRRTVVFDGRSDAPPSSLLPVLLHAGALAANRPYSEMFVSPCQRLYFVQTLAESHLLPQLRGVSAIELANESDAAVPVVTGRYEYHAIFTEYPQLMEVNGVLAASLGMMGLELEDDPPIDKSHWYEGEFPSLALKKFH